MALPEARQDLTEAVLAAHPLPEAGPWLTQAREAARLRLAALGMPMGRDEYWKFTRPDAWTGAKAHDASSEASRVFDAAAPLTLVFVDGVFDADASDDTALEHVKIERLADVSHTDLHWAKALYGVLEASANEAPRVDGARLFKPVARPLAALNTATAEDGLLIHATGAVARPIRISYRSGGGEAVLHHLVKVDPGASLTLLEEGQPGGRSNVMLEADIAETGTFHHLRIQAPEQDRATLTNLFARTGVESTFKSFGFTANGAATRNEAVLEILGDNAVAHIAGGCLGDGARGKFHHDDTVYITHDAVNCESRQVFKKVLRNGAVGVFQGKILVQPHAQKTDGYQISQSLLLDDDSQFLAKPELEIYADDVACSHGSTSGAIDEEALFYLRSRGVPRKTAENLLTLSFLAEALDEIEDAELAEMVLGQIEGWLAD
ncbi:MAG: SufD family Fe-S cluster assembly protein [Pseudomonadota bacterium]